MFVHKSRKSGFTLIELLVVIAIIAILAAILFPVFAQVREKARQTTCASNLSQIGLAVLQYSQDYDENYPYCATTSTLAKAASNNWDQDWSILVQPYVRNGSNGKNWAGSTSTGVWTCPSFPTEGKSGLAEYAQYTPINDIFPFEGNWPYTSWTAPTALNAVDRPAEKIMVFERGMNGPNCFGSPATLGVVGSGNEWFWTNGNSVGSHLNFADPKDTDNLSGAVPCWTWQSGAYYPRYRHNGYANFLFADGHVKAMRKGSVLYNVNIEIGPQSAAY
jgi:prepilin-type N-terminal cleavage/methylation domain-containing protein/prepilin-type processing-associated H-X9-DG protein